MTQADWPHVHPDPQVLGDAEMIASGAFGAREGFADDLPLAAEVASLTRASGGVVLVDDEGAPVVAVSSDGTVQRLAHPESGAFRHLHRSPADISASTPRAGVLVDRPLLASEVRALADVGASTPVLLLVRTVDPHVPADVLIRATLAVSAHIPHSQVVTVPFARRDDVADDRALSEVVLRSYEAVPVPVASDDDGWPRVLEALDRDDSEVLAQLLDQATLDVLRRWRPPRPERGLVVFFTGLSGSGKSTIARGLVDRLHETDRTLTVLDGDVARRMLSSGLGFSREDRDTNIRRLGWVAAEVARHGGLAVLAPIAPFATTRAEVRSMVEAQGDLVMVWVSTPLAECERRDRKGLYAKARRGEIPDFTGISSPYEPPREADLVIDTSDVSVDEAVEQVWGHLVEGGWIV